MSFFKIVYSTLYEVVVDFTRDYESIKQGLNKVEHYDKTCLENVLQAVNNILISNWGSQNYCQIIVFSDCGIGLGPTSLNNTIKKFQKIRNAENENLWLPYPYPSKINIVCLGNTSDPYFLYATKLYQQFFDVTGQKGQLYIPKCSENLEIIKKEEFEVTTPSVSRLTKQSVFDAVVKMCETNYKQFEAIFKCGSYFKLECPIFIWPPPLPYSSKDVLGCETTKSISRKIEVCGYIKLSDIGSPMSVSRHLILPKAEEKIPAIKVEKASKVKATTDQNLTTDFEKLESEIRSFYSKTDGSNSDDDETVGNTAASEATRESVCVLLHGALKVESMAALVLLNDDWYGFIFPYADSKKKSNLMLTILPPGHNNIPWLGDLRFLGTSDDSLPGENPSFPVKPEKRSYSQNCVVWIRQAGLQSDIQKVLRHAKKLPEKTQHFYKDLNRIRRAALSLGFIELLEGLSFIFERELSSLPSTASPDCALQLKHAAMELRKISSRDMKNLISAAPTKYNQL